MSKELRIFKWVKINIRGNLEVSAGLAIAAIAGLAVLAIFFPAALIVLPAAACGYGIGYFHGMKNEIERKG